MKLNNGGGHRLILINVNHTPSAQDLLYQVIAERGVNIAVVAKLYRVPPDHPRWAPFGAGCGHHLAAR